MQFGSNNFLGIWKYQLWNFIYYYNFSFLTIAIKTNNRKIKRFCNSLENVKKSQQILIYFLGLYQKISTYRMVQGFLCLFINKNTSYFFLNNFKSSLDHHFNSFFFFTKKFIFNYVQFGSNIHINNNSCSLFLKNL